MIESTTRIKVNSFLSRFNHLNQKIEEERECLEQGNLTVKNATEAQKILQNIAQAVQTEAHANISKVVSKCLETVFEDDPYQFEIIFNRKRGKTEAEIVFVRNGNQIHPMKGSGGGPIAIASFALRLACLVLSMPAKRKVLFLDEPFLHLHEQYHHLIPKMLRTIAKEMKVQIIMATNEMNYKTGKVIEL